VNLTSPPQFLFKWACEHTKQQILETLNPHPVHEVPLCDIKVSVWYILSSGRIMGPILNEDKLIQRDTAGRPVTYG
jgi:hypothetical protein